MRKTVQQAMGASDVSSSVTELYVDPSGLVHPTAIVAATAADYEAAITSMTAKYTSNLSCMGDPGVQSAWAAFHSAWTAELGVAAQALSTVAKLVPAAVHALANADVSSSLAIQHTDKLNQDLIKAIHDAGGTKASGSEGGATGPSGDSQTTETSPRGRKGP